jgi:hypothetical protein
MSKRKAKEMFMKIIETKKHITFTPWMLRIFGRIEYTVKVAIKNNVEKRVKYPMRN